MKNTFGNSISLTLFGESHGAYIGAVLDGLAPGISINEDFIRSQLDKRRPVGKIGTARHEADEFQIVSGAFEGKTTGTPLTILRCGMVSALTARTPLISAGFWLRSAIILRLWQSCPGTREIL